MSKRVDFVDVAKGICILLVVVHHSELGSVHFQQLNKAIGLFRMPLFFLLSGLFFKESLSFKAEILKRSDYLLKPYFTVLLLIFLLGKMGHIDEPWPHEFLGIFYATGHTIRIPPLWFLAHLWLLHLFSYLMFKHFQLLKQPVLVKAIVLSSMMGVGLLVMNYYRTHISELEINPNLGEVIGLPFSLDFLLISFVYFALGRMLSEQTVHFKTNFLWLSVAFIVFLGVSLFTKAEMNLAYRTYYEWAYVMMASFSGIYLILCLSEWITSCEVTRKLFAYLGASSLFILIFHLPIERHVASLLRKTHLLETELQLAILAFCVCVLGSLLMRWLITRSRFLSLFFVPLKSNPWFKSQ